MEEKSGYHYSDIQFDQLLSQGKCEDRPDIDFDDQEVLRCIVEHVRCRGKDVDEDLNYQILRLIDINAKCWNM
jgi:hypothetical protein